jgi:hypothetical protein
MTLTYSELMDLCTLGERLRFWRHGFPGKPDGIRGVHVLNETWRLIPAPEIEADPQLTMLVQEIITNREVNQPGAKNDKQTRKQQRA